MQELSEKEAENFLEKQGFSVIQRKIIKNKRELKVINFNFPWVMKVSSSKIIHKAKVGGIFVGIKNLAEASKTYDSLEKIKDFDGVMIQPMQKGLELIIGLKKTKEFDQVILLGKGGSQVEKEKDISFRVIPITKEDTQQMIDELKISELLKKETSLDLIKENLLKMSKLAEKYPQIEELDINPLIINKDEAKVVDARIILS